MMKTDQYHDSVLNGTFFTFTIKTSMEKYGGRE